MKQLSIAYLQLTGLFILFNNLYSSIFIDEKLDHPPLTILVYNMVTMVLSGLCFVGIAFGIAQAYPLNTFEFTAIAIIITMITDTLCWFLLLKSQAKQLISGIIFTSLVSGICTFGLYHLLSFYTCVVTHFC